MLRGSVVKACFIGRQSKSTTSFSESTFRLCDQYRKPHIGILNGVRKRQVIIIKETCSGERSKKKTNIGLQFYPHPPDEVETDGQGEYFD